MYDEKTFVTPFSICGENESKITVNTSNVNKFIGKKRLWSELGSVTLSKKAPRTVFTQKRMTRSKKCTTFFEIAEEEPMDEVEKPHKILTRN